MKNQALGCVVLLATLSWQLGLSEHEVTDPETPKPDSNLDDQNCMHRNGVRLVAKKESDGEEQGTVQVEVCNEKSMWMHICNANGPNITRVCNRLGGTLMSDTMMTYTVCEVKSRNTDILECLMKRDCRLGCLSSRPTATTPPTSFTPPAKSTTIFIKPKDTTTTTTERASVTIDSSMIMGIRTERNLAVVIGGSLAGLILLLVGMIAVILIIVVMLYKTKHKRENLSSARPKSTGTGVSDDSLTVRYVPSHNYTVPQPAEYEVFQPSSVTTITSNMPLLDADPQPYEVLEKYAKQPLGDRDTNGVYETVKNITPQDNERSSSVDGHIYFTLEPRDDVK